MLNLPWKKEKNFNKLCHLDPLQNKSVEIFKPPFDQANGR